MAQNVLGTQRMDTFLRDLVWQILTSEVNTIMPGSVVSYDSATATAQIQPANKIVFEDGTSQLAPIIQDVPVFFPGGAGGGLTWPVAAGDFCLILCAQRSLDA